SPILADVAPAHFLRPFNTCIKSACTGQRDCGAMVAGDGLAVRGDSCACLADRKGNFLDSRGSFSVMGSSDEYCHRGGGVGSKHLLLGPCFSSERTALLSGWTYFQLGRATQRLPI